MLNAFGCQFFFGDGDSGPWLRLRLQVHFVRFLHSLFALLKHTHSPTHTHTHMEYSFISCIFSAARNCEQVDESRSLRRPLYSHVFAASLEPLKAAAAGIKLKLTHLLCHRQSSWGIAPSTLALAWGQDIRCPDSLLCADYEI